jgi:RNA polymerase sigma-70 factor (ECF subfamily)
LEHADATERFYQWVWPHRATITRAAQIQTGNAAEADDLAQETLLKAFRSIDRFVPGTNARSWLLAIMRNARIDSLRRSANAAGQVSLDGAVVEVAASTASPSRESDEAARDVEQLLSAFSDAQVIEALQQVSEELRWTLLLVDVEEMDHKEAAEILGVPVGTVKSRVHRGRAMLRETLLPLARDRRLVRE